MHLNNISIPKLLTTSFEGSQFMFYYSIQTNFMFGDENDVNFKLLMKNHFNNCTAKNTDIGLVISGFVDLSPKFKESMTIDNSKSPYPWISRDSIKGIIQSVILDTPLSAFIMHEMRPFDQIPDDPDAPLLTNEERVKTKEPETYRIGPIKRESKNQVISISIDFPAALVYSLGLTDDVNNTERKKYILYGSGEERNMITGSEPLTGSYVAFKFRNHIYLKCSICESGIIDKKARKILKVIPIMSDNLNLEYYHYEALTPEYMLIGHNNLEYVQFRLTDDDGNEIYNAGSKLPTFLTCSIVTE
jgi:hypothetical protein